MDFKDLITQLGQRAEELKEHMPTEEATKNALIMPMIAALGYNVFNPTEVLPEFTCDIGTKKGEKIDYAIMQDGKPVILIECKHWQQDLTLHDNQLLRYFNVSSAKFGILTNGLKYRFYTDLQEPNKMDEVPFLEINIQELTDGKIEELKKFHKSYFDVDNVLNTASELKYLGEFRNVIHSEFQKPSADFVRFMAKQFYHGVLTQRVMDELTPLLKRSIDAYINNLISDRLKVAMQNEKAEEEKDEEKAQKGETQAAEVVTTEEEMEGYYIIKAILSRIINPTRISYRDRKDYFAIILDDKVNKTICRLRFNYASIRRVSFNWKDRPEESIDLPNGDINEIYKYESTLIELAKMYE